MLHKGDIVSTLRPKVGFRTDSEGMVRPVNLDAGIIGRIVCYDELDGSGYMLMLDRTSVDFYWDEVEVLFHGRH